MRTFTRTIVKARRLSGPVIDDVRNFATEKGVAWWLENRC